ncbi:pyridoxamine 5'-phosphate oxidase family protein [Nocardioides donggukensis]|uniref:Pyridoxamine 5'-phosphate oxidase family protein n=1 Tax=Nocardioides donggukensis TaxID=2774019 RepID=A0A927K9M4_9ACTN|nr:pyridoxamine 5'-phosphate oxidase family protein [Nocardioides donggukensis]MBD8870175.1 pyridoxamine 5'-phosphate oxidase family protein [Nocardioides donggukensis]
MRDWIALDPSECESLLRAGVVGRMAVFDGTRPHILPLNYAVVGDALLVRTGADSLLARLPDRTPLAFEVDALDHDGHRGWSVVAHGRSERIDSLDEVDRLDRGRGPRPWVAGTRPHHLRLRWSSLTGYRLGTGWDLRAAMPVRRAE